MSYGMDPFGMAGSGRAFDLFFVVFFLVFGVMLAVFLAAAVRGIAGWKKNNDAPRLTVCAQVVTKRTNVTHFSHASGGFHGSNYTTYYVTFAFDSGDRQELHVPAAEYGLLAEGDKGLLTVQGTRYLGFEREK